MALDFGMQPSFICCTPLAIMEQLKEIESDYLSKKIVIMGASHLVGLPLY